MLRVEESIQINRPVEDVFTYTTDIARFPEWAAMVNEAHQTSDGPLRVGSTYQTALQFLGRRFVADQQVTAYEPNHIFAARSTSGPVPMVLTMTMEPADGGTHYTFVLEGESRGFFALADALLLPIGRRQLQTQLETLKTLLEAEAVATA